MISTKATQADLEANNNTTLLSGVDGPKHTRLDISQVRRRRPKLHLLWKVESLLEILIGERVRHLNNMKTLQIATLGLHANQRIDYVLNKRGADKLVLIGTEENREDVEDFSHRYSKQKFPIAHCFVDPWNYEQILAKVLTITLDHSDYLPEYNISCGSPTMRVACHMAAVLTESPVHFVTQKDDEVIGDLVTIKPLPLSRLTRPKHNILSSLAGIEQGVNSQRELGTKVGLGVTSISKHLKELKSAGFVRSIEEGNRKSTQITDLGKIILRLKDTRKQRIWSK